MKRFKGGDAVVKRTTSTRCLMREFGKYYLYD